MKSFIIAPREITTNAGAKIQVLAERLGREPDVRIINSILPTTNHLVIETSDEILAALRGEIEQEFIIEENEILGF